MGVLRKTPHPTMRSGPSRTARQREGIYDGAVNALVMRTSSLLIGLATAIVILTVAVVAGRRAAGAAHPVVGAESVAVPEPGR